MDGKVAKMARHAIIQSVNETFSYKDVVLVADVASVFDKAKAQLIEATILSRGIPETMLS